MRGRTNDSRLFLRLLSWSCRARAFGRGGTRLSRSIPLICRTKQDDVTRRGGTINNKPQYWRTHGRTFKTAKTYHISTGSADAPAQLWHIPYTFFLRRLPRCTIWASPPSSPPVALWGSPGPRPPSNSLRRQRGNQIKRKKKRNEKKKKRHLKEYYGKIWYWCKR